MKPQLKKGFTLIELMIVVAIIGVLAVTIVPALTGAQARARDAGRIAGLQNISAVLETYFTDNGKYPLSNAATSGISTTDGETGFKGCISNGSGSTAPDLQAMFKGARAPINPQKTSISGNCGEEGAYGYVAIQKDGIDQSGYVILADVESFNKANALLVGTTAPATDGATATSSYEIMVKLATMIAWGKQSADPAATVDTWGGAGAKGTVYGVTN